MSGPGVRRVRRLCGPGLAVALAWAAPALAVDGSFEIHPACVAGGCFPGDSGGFPVTLASPGSYRLTGDLVVPDENTTAIEVQADHVSIDLNGFTIRGVTNCVANGAPPTGVTCSPVGIGVGILGSTFTTLEVHGGTIAGMGAQGLANGDPLVARDLVVQENGAGGVVVDATGVLLSSLMALENGGHGFDVLGGVVRGSFAQQNGGDGIRCVDCVVVDSQLKLNVGDGIACENCTVRGNLATLNRGFGLRGSDRTGYVGNVFVSNSGGQVSGAVELGENLCGGDAICP